MAAGSIKSIQTGTVSWLNTSVATGTATITSVVTAKSYVILGGFTANGTAGYDQRSNSVSIVLTNATTVTAQSGATVVNSGTITVYFTVVEFY